MENLDKKEIYREVWVDHVTDKPYVRITEGSDLVGHVPVYENVEVLKAIKELNKDVERVGFPKIVPQSLDEVVAYSKLLIGEVCELHKIKESAGLLLRNVKEPKLKTIIKLEYSKVETIINKRVEDWALLSPLWARGEYKGMRYGGANLNNFECALYELYDYNKIEKQIEDGNFSVEYVDKFGLKYNATTQDIIMNNMVKQILSGDKNFSNDYIRRYLTLNKQKDLEQIFLRQEKEKEMEL